ncbi:MAG: threo-3-hydroxy-L-aspartate ammonia-lyase [Betaproteobacteria bacterium]|nr:MAG: threo-3-hydroxy-L-aspartate ammonia-lyase [Betaproteobacteria bacterium]
MGEMRVTYADIAAAHERIKGAARRTPVLTSSSADALIGAELFFKCENLQRMGAFKFRGAYNALSQLGPEERKRGVLAFSSGNHAQAVALAGKLLGIKTLIVMPENAPKVKLDATRGYGAEVVTYGKDEERETVAARLAKERGMVTIPPFNHPHIVAGQGTAAKELLEDAGALDMLVVPCGGAGLLSGCAVATRHLAPQCHIVGVEPAAGDDVTQSFRAGKIVTIAVPDTIADGARTTAPGSVTFPLVQRYVNEMATVTDEELLPAMFWLWERMKIVVEPTGALAFAALVTKKVKAKGRVGVVLSGGNVDLRWAAAQFGKH